MGHKILVGIDCSANAQRALDYVGTMLRPHDDILVTLFHVLIAPQPDIYPDRQQRERELEKRHGRALRQLEAMQARLVTLGVPKDRITMKIQVCAPEDNVAVTLLEEQRRGGYQTVVVGRRGMSKREEFLFGSVSSKIIREARECTVWVVQ
ncbi:universal stress protein [Desulfosoma caldarium]|uniref:Nucleotide-binding universal stress UspA family protein n=1 Tax=Desulfosoma caldarium TaxID=610254 RepID=A0A3N1UQH4_9BACT|nr:universal stress protein [Desulfosoma caldarium]ROQ93365.1 nucleotide-binding universal stress UspA family protein [Desulfosoma caldarium]